MTDNNPNQWRLVSPAPPEPAHKDRRRGDIKLEAAVLQPSPAQPSPAQPSPAQPDHSRPCLATTCHQPRIVFFQSYNIIECF